MKDMVPAGWEANSLERPGAYRLEIATENGYAYNLHISVWTLDTGALQADEIDHLEPDSGGRSAG